jgi:hypothetical protein
MLMWLKSTDPVFGLPHVLPTSVVKHSNKLKFLTIMQDVTCTGITVATGITLATTNICNRNLERSDD